MVTLDWNRLKRFLPNSGKLLDVGCGVGSLTYEIALSSPKLQVTGIDNNPQNIVCAKKYNSLPNIQYDCKELWSIQEFFDCILYVDVLHHIPQEEHDHLLKKSVELLTSQGFLLIKEVEKRYGQMAWFLDRVISRCPRIYQYRGKDLARIISTYLQDVKFETSFSPLLPSYFIRGKNSQ